MNLSVCLLSRKDTSNLARSLASVCETADEIIVSDTFASEQVQSIAGQFRARVSAFPWCDDCAAARNHCLDQAEGDWILWIDADEVLLPHKLIERAGPHAVGKRSPLLAGLLSLLVEKVGHHIGLEGFNESM